MPSRLQEILAQLDNEKGPTVGGGLGTAGAEEVDKGPGGLQRLLSRLTTPLVDVPDLPGGIVGDVVEKGIEDFSSPVGLLSAALIPVTGGASFGLKGAAGVATRLGTRALGETAVGGVASIAARKTLDALPEDAPGILRLGAVLGAGIAAGGVTSVGIRGAVGRTSVAVNPAQLGQVIRQTTNSPEAAEFATLISRASRVPSAVSKKLLDQQRASQLGAAEGAAATVLASGAGGAAATNAASAAAQGTFKRVDLKFAAGSHMSVDLPLKLKNQIGEAGNLDQTLKWDARRGLDRLLAGSVPNDTELHALEQAFGTGFTRAINLKSGNMNVVMQALNAPRALVASADLSAPFRQGIMLIGHPKEFFGNIKGMVRAFGDETYYNNQMAFLRGNAEELKALGHTPEFIAKAQAQAVRANKAKLAFTGSLNQHEEQFIGALGGPFKNSAAARAIGASERSYTLYLNRMRRDVFNKVADNLVNSNAGTRKNLRDYAGFLNAATGRGPKQVLDNELGKVLNAAFFAPGYFISRLNAPTYLFRASGEVRTQVWKDMGAFVGTGAATLTMLKLASNAGFIPGLTVESDPRSSDFGKVRVGNTRYDFWGGYQQIARSTVQAVSGSRKTSSGRVTEANRGSTLQRFAQSKLSPSAGIAVDLLRGETFMGTEVDLKDPNFVADSLLAEHLIPLALQDLEDGFYEGGAVGGAMSVPALFGVGTQTFISMRELKDDLADEIFDTPTYDGLTGDQRKLIEQHPRFIEKERELDNKAGIGFREQSEDIENQRTVSQRAFFARLTSGTLTRKEFADALGDAQIRASTRRDQAARDFEIQGFEPGSALATVLNGWYELFGQADMGAEFGVETNQLDWELFDQLEHDYLAKLDPAERDFIDMRSRRGNAPEVEWFYNNREYINNAGYYDVSDTVFERFSSQARRTFPEVQTYGDLISIQTQASLSGDYRRERQASNILARIDREVGKRREQLRKRDPKLDAALWHTGRTSKVLTRKANDFIPDFGLAN